MGLKKKSVTVLGMSPSLVIQQITCAISYAKQKTPQAVRNPFEPMLKTVEQMAVVSGIGENRLRQLMDNGELEFIQNGNRRLISEQAIWDYYNRAKTPARSVSGGC